MEQFKIHPNKLKNLRPGTALVFSPGKEECLALTASVYKVFGAQAACLPCVPAPKEEGLDLESAERDFAGVERLDENGLVKA